MINLNTKTKNLGRVKTISIANMALRWCRTNMGVNQRKKYLPIWSVRQSCDSDCGEYDAYDNEVYIYYNNCHTIKELIGTCIHEWQHQLQPILTKYHTGGPYSNNPYEKVARKVEKELTPVCWAHMDKRLNKKTNEQSNRSIRTRRNSINKKIKGAKGW